MTTSGSLRTPNFTQQQQQQHALLHQLANQPWSALQAPDATLPQPDGSPVTPPNAHGHNQQLRANGMRPPPPTQLQFQPQQHVNMTFHRQRAQQQRQQFPQAGGPGGFQPQQQRACLDWMRDGMCQFGEKCIFSHNQPAQDNHQQAQEMAMMRLRNKHAQELLECQTNGKYRTRVCKHWLAGRCTFGSQCKFAHGGNQMRQGMGFTQFPIYGNQGQVIGVQNLHNTRRGFNPQHGHGRFANGTRVMMPPGPLRGQQQPPVMPTQNYPSTAGATAKATRDLDPIIQAALQHATSAAQRELMLRVYNQALQQEITVASGNATIVNAQQHHQQQQQPEEQPASPAQSVVCSPTPSLGSLSDSSLLSDGLPASFDAQFDRILMLGETTSQGNLYASLNSMPTKATSGFPQIPGNSFASHQMVNVV